MERNDRVPPDQTTRAREIATIDFRVRSRSADDDRESPKAFVALASAIAVTLGFLASLDHLMSDPSRWSLPQPRYIEARLIDRSIPVEPVVAAKAAPASGAIGPRVRIQARISSALPAAAPHSTATRTPLDLFTRDGAIRLPTDLSSVPPDRNDRLILLHKRPIPIAPERFAWSAPARETLGGTLLRRFYDHKWTLPWGTVIACGQGEPIPGAAIVFECRPENSVATGDELRAMRADPPANNTKAHPSASFARRDVSARRASFASLGN
jgi:hypothetical protein